MKAYCAKIIEKILSGEIKTQNQLDDEKRKLSSELGLKRFIRNSEILKYAKPREKPKVLKILQKKPTRTLSGVAVIAAMTKPLECPHGKCRYCPGGPELNVPQSYTGEEPATRRAIRYGYDPYLQVTFRLKQLSDIGHPVGKAELIVMGGTLTAQPLRYQKEFVRGCLEAMNDFDQSFGKIQEIGDEDFIKEAKKRKPKTIEDVQKDNETASVRCVGMTFEPRPDWAKTEQINDMLGFGVTRVEIGVQNPSDKIYRMVERGHTVKDVAESTQQLKDSGMKVAYHLMPGLLGHKPKQDLDAFKRVFTDERFKPDMIKIYPCIVLEGTDYYKQWKAGKFEPMTTGQAVDLIVKMKKMMPPWARTMRVMRDIPSTLVKAGIRASNLGQLVYERLEAENVRCRCIRCREVGRFLVNGIEPEPSDTELVKREYTASGGKEVFLSFEDTKQDILVGFLRLRIPYKPFRPEIDERTALIRELHVYGPMVQLGEKPRKKWQHRGYGHEMLEGAEEISKDMGMGKILVTSGIGARQYYRKFGYKRDGVYMGKAL